MRLPTLTEQVIAASQARQREAALDARISQAAAKCTRRDAAGNPVPGTRSRIVQYLADGREHNFAEILVATGDRQSRAAWALCSLVDSGRVERIGEKKPFRYRIA